MTTVFDLGGLGYQAWPVPALGLVIAALSFLFFWIPEGFLTLGAIIMGRRLSFQIGFMIGISESVIALTVTYVPYHHALLALEEGDYKIAEGELTQFNPGRLIRPSLDQSFIVGDKRFRVDRSAISGFTGFGSDEVPSIIDPTGQIFRISYLDGNPPEILRIQLIEPNSSSVKNSESR